MYVFLQERDSLCHESVASENSTSKSKYFIIQRAHSLLYTPLPPPPPHPLVPCFSSAFGCSNNFGQFLVLPAVVAIIILSCFGQMVCPVDLSILLQ